MTLLDNARIRRRRQQLRISQRQLARTLGVSLPVVARLEDGTNHDQLTVSLLHALADALSLTPAELHQPAPPTPPEDEDDAAIIGALLTEAGVLTPKTTLAYTLGWPLPRVDDAVAALGNTARLAGQRVHQLRGQVALVRDDTAPEIVTSLLRRQHARAGLSVFEARLLKTVADGAQPQQLQGNAAQVALGRLRNADYITRDETPELTDDVAYSLEI